MLRETWKGTFQILPSQRFSLILMILKSKDNIIVKAPEMLLLQTFPNLLLMLFVNACYLMTLSVANIL
jgi:hypothetical protein